MRLYIYTSAVKILSTNDIRFSDDFIEKFAKFIHKNNEWKYDERIKYNFRCGLIVTHKSNERVRERERERESDCECKRALK